MSILLNGTLITTVDPAATATLDEFGGVAGPWRVKIVDPSSGQLVGEREVSIDEGPLGTLIEVRATDGDVLTIGDVRTGTGC